MEFFYAGNLSSVPYLFIYSIIHSCQYGLKSVYLIFGAVIQYYIIFFVAVIVIAWHFQFLCLFVITPLLLYCLCLFCYCSLLSGTMRCSKLIFYTSYLNTRFSHFSKESIFLLLKNVIRNPNLGIQRIIVFEVSVFLDSLVGRVGK